MLKMAFRLGVWGLILAAIPSLGGDGAPPPIKRDLSGRLTTKGELRVLELWGTPRDAGFAHGYLLAEDIVTLFDDFVLDPKVVPSHEFYEGIIRPNSGQRFEWSPAARDELAGILAGAQSRLGKDKVRSAKLDRPLDLDDMLAINALADWFCLACSSVSLWGPLTSDGQTLTARNLDFPSTVQMDKLQIVIAYRGAGERKSWLGVSWPGAIGVYTAMNADGVTMSIHDAPGRPMSAASGFTPRSLILREALEGAAAGSFATDVAKVLRAHKVAIGNNVHVSAPRNGDAAPARIFEYDAGDLSGGVTERIPDPAAGALANALWCTNHQRERQPPLDCDRYTKLQQRLTEASTAGTRFDAASALRLIRDIRQESTLHSVVFMPAKGKMLVLIPSVAEVPVEFDLNADLTKSGATTAMP